MPRMIVAPSADLELAVRAIASRDRYVVAAAPPGRLIAHREDYDRLVTRLKAVIDTVAIGDPLDEATYMGRFRKAPFDHAAPRRRLRKAEPSYGGEQVRRAIAILMLSRPPGAGRNARPDSRSWVPRDLCADPYAMRYDWSGRGDRCCRTMFPGLSVLHLRPMTSA